MKQSITMNRQFTGKLMKKVLYALKHYQLLKFKEAINQNNERIHLSGKI